MIASTSILASPAARTADLVPPGPPGGPAPDPGVALIRAVYDAHARSDLPAVLSLATPDVELRQSDQLPWGGHFTGAAGARRFLGTLVQHLDSRMEPRAFISAGDRVVAIGRTRGTVRATGAAFDVEAVHVFTLRDGRLAGFEAYVDTPAMLAALRHP